MKIYLITFEKKEDSKLNFSFLWPKIKRMCLARLGSWDFGKAVEARRSFTLGTILS